MFTQACGLVGDVLLAQLMLQVYFHCKLDHTLQRTATHCCTMQHTATSRPTHAPKCIYTVTYCNTLQCIAAHCDAQQHTATHHTATQRNISPSSCSRYVHHAALCNTLKHTYIYVYKYTCMGVK